MSRAQVRISPTAWMKIQTLVMGYDKEVGWFCTVERIAKFTYRIKDVLIYPQYSNGTYVEDGIDNPLAGNEWEMRDWIDSLPDDIFNERRGQGHSHVNMGVTPSGTDTSYWKTFAETNARADINRYTVTMIINKKMDMMWWVFDADEKIEFKNSDIDVAIEVEEGVTNSEYFKASKELVKDMTLRGSTTFLFGISGNKQASAGTYLFAKPEHTQPAYPYYGSSSQKKESKVKEMVNALSAPKKVEVDYTDIPFDDDTPDDDYLFHVNGANSWTISMRKDESTVNKLWNRPGADQMKYYDVVCEDVYGNTYCLTDYIKQNEEPAENNFIAQKDSVANALYSGVIEKEFDSFIVTTSDGEELLATTKEDVVTLMGTKVKDTKLISHKNGDKVFTVITVIDSKEVA